MKAGRESILVGTDFSGPSRLALLQALSLARERDCAMLVLHVIDAPNLEELARLAGIKTDELRARLGRERRERLTAFLAEADDSPGEVVFEPIIAWGRPYEEILKRAYGSNVSLIVLGLAGHSADAERALFGSTADKVLRATPCPVLCVPSD